MRTILTFACLLLAALPASAANFPYIRLNGKTNVVSDNGTNLTYNGSAIGGGSVTYPSITNTMSWSGNTNNVIGGDGRERTVAGAGSTNLFDSGVNVMARGSIYSPSAFRSQLTNYVGNDEVPGLVLIPPVSSHRNPWSVEQTVGLNAPGSSRSNVIYSTGYNLGRADPLDYTLETVLETWWDTIGTTNKANIEWYMQYYDIQGGVIRPFGITYAASTDGSFTNGGNAVFNVDTFGIFSRNGTPELSIANGVISGFTQYELSLGGTNQVWYVNANGQTQTGGITITNSYTGGHPLVINDSDAPTSPGHRILFTAGGLTKFSVDSGGAITTARGVRQYQGVITPTDAGVNLIFDDWVPNNSMVLTGAVTFTTSDVATNLTYNILIKNNQASNCPATFPSGWHWLGGKPTSFTAGKWGKLMLEAWGTGDTNIIAGYSEETP